MEWFILILGVLLIGIAAIGFIRIHKINIQVDEENNILEKKKILLQEQCNGLNKTIENVENQLNKIQNSRDELTQGLDKHKELCDKAFENYRSPYLKGVNIKYKNTTEDNLSFCLYIRIITEFGILFFLYLIFKYIKIYWKSDFKYKLPLTLIVAYLYVQFDSYAFYSIWLLLLMLILTRKGGSKSANKTIKQN